MNSKEVQSKTQSKETKLQMNGVPRKKRENNKSTIPNELELGQKKNEGQGRIQYTT